MRTLILFSLILAALPASADAVYKTVDEDGRVIYTDQRPDDDSAEAEELPPVNSVPETRGEPRRDRPSGPPQEEEAMDYELTLTGPLPDTSVPPGQRDLPITVQVNPALEPGHVFAYYLDGELLSETTERQFVVQEIYRGSHEIEVEVLDASGQVLSTAGPVTVHVHRPTVNRPGGG